METPSAYDPAYMAGWDFCWFVRDEAGQYAALTTGGEGPVPDAVVAHADRHNDIECALDRSLIGTADWWKAWAAVGLFVYDWSAPTVNPGPAIRTFFTALYRNLRDPGGTRRGVTAGVRAYRRLGVPTAAMPESIATDLRDLPGVLVYPGDFRERLTIDVDALRESGDPS